MPLDPCTPLMTMGSPPMLPDQRKRKMGEANKGRTTVIAVLPVTLELATAGRTLQLRLRLLEEDTVGRNRRLE